MTDKNLRLEGIYPQRQKEFFMQRVKLPAGIISAVKKDSKTVASSQLLRLELAMCSQKRRIETDHPASNRWCTMTRKSAPRQMLRQNM